MIITFQFVIKVLLQWCYSLRSFLLAAFVAALFSAVQAVHMLCVLDWILLVRVSRTFVTRAGFEKN